MRFVARGDVVGRCGSEAPSPDDDDLFDFPEELNAVLEVTFSVSQ